jgi:ribosomal protein L31/DNA-binding protein
MVLVVAAACLDIQSVNAAGAANQLLHVGLSLELDQRVIKSIYDVDFTGVQTNQIFPLQQLSNIAYSGRTEDQNHDDLRDHIMNPNDYIWSVSIGRLTGLAIGNYHNNVNNNAGISIELELQNNVTVTERSTTISNACKSLHSVKKSNQDGLSIEKINIRNIPANNQGGNFHNLSTQAVREAIRENREYALISYLISPMNTMHDIVLFTLDQVNQAAGALPVANANIPAVVFPIVPSVHSHFVHNQQGVLFYNGNNVICNVLTASHIQFTGNQDDITKTNTVMNFIPRFGNNLVITSR